jgi:hypothetical protein
MSAGDLDTITSLSGELKNVATVMRNTFYLAVSISPLVVLYPRKLESEGIRRDYLISVRCLIPNPVFCVGLMKFFIACCRNGE